MINKGLSYRSIDLQVLKSRLDYDPYTGMFRWKPSYGGRFGGCIAGATNKKGYIQIGIDRVYHMAHRLAWLYVYGTIPESDIDHVNRNRGDNRIANLRIATTSQNQFNRLKAKRNSSGFKGVYWRQREQKWISSIKFNGTTKHLGTFNTPEEASAAYGEAAKKYHGEFARVS